MVQEVVFLFVIVRSAHHCYDEGGPKVLKSANSFMVDHGCAGTWAKVRMRLCVCGCIQP